MRSVALVGVVVTLIGLAPAPSSAASRTYVTNDCRHIRVRPRSIMFACADAGFYVTRLDWQRWLVHRAAGDGVFHRNDCLPDCADGTFRTRHGTIRLRHRLWCPDVGSYVFRRATIVYRHPLLGRSRTAFRLSCPY
jgi:hypothetical protein